MFELFYEKLVAEQEAWDKAMREFAAKKLTALANDWLAEDKENITSGGSFTAYYNDDDMSWGHAVEVSGSLKKGITYTNLAG